MKIKKNDSSYTVTPEPTDNLLMYIHPYITDGVAVVNIEAIRTTIKCIGEFKPLLAEKVKAKESFFVKLGDEGYVEHPLPEADLSRAFAGMESAASAELCPFSFMNPETGESISLISQGGHIKGIKTAYADILNGGSVTCGSLVFVLCHRKRLGDIPFAAIATVKLNSSEYDDVREWLERLGEVAG